MAAYREQLDRVARWFSRFQDIHRGRSHNRDADYYIDEINAFFQNCYHLKDWIKHDPSLPSSVTSAVEGHVDSSRWLQLCADLCNGTKHLKLTNSRSREYAEFGKKAYSVTLGKDQTISLRYEVETSQGIEDAFEIASNSLAAWEAFLKLHGLL